MDFLLVLKGYEVLVCTKCGYVVNPCRLAAHLRTNHGRELRCTSQSAVALANRCFEELQLHSLPAYTRKVDVPDPETLPLEGLTVQQGFGCSLCPTIRRDKTAMSSHFTEKYPFKRKMGEKPWSEVVFQQFTRSGLNKTMFRVRMPTAIEHEQIRRWEDIAAHRVKSSHQVHIKERLDEEESNLVARSTVRLGVVAPTEVSPWLKTTRWRQYLGTYPLRQLAALASIHDPVQEPLLDIISSSLERVVHAAHQSVSHEKIHGFGPAANQHLPIARSITRSTAVGEAPESHLADLHQLAEALLVLRRSVDSTRSSNHSCTRSYVQSAEAFIRITGMCQRSFDAIAGASSTSGGFGLCVSVLMHKSARSTTSWESL